MKAAVVRLCGVALLIVGVSGSAMASVPEIDPGLGINALALLGGAVLVIRSARRK